MTILGPLLLVAAATQADAGMCGFCHPDVRVEFEQSIHASEEVPCVACHGGDPSASTVEGAHRGSFVREMRRSDIPGICASCHADPARMRPYDLPTDQLALYQTSQHGRALARGNEQVAVCTDCHGAHRILPPGDPRSRVHPRNTPKTCSNCHSNASLMKTYGHDEDPLAGFLAGRHGKALMERGDDSAPECSRCHGAHGAAPPGFGDVNRVCGQCHTSERVYFLESPHREGMDAAGLPECSSCHGHHEIDRVEVEEIESVCQRCHASDSAEAELGRKMKTLYQAATSEVDTASGIVRDAARVPLYVEDYDARLEEAHTSLVEARTAMHALDLDLVDRLAGRARSIGQEVESEVHRKLDGLRWRRIGLLVFWFYLIVTVATLVHFRRKAVGSVTRGSLS